MKEAAWMTSGWLSVGLAGVPLVLWLQSVTGRLSMG